MGNNTIKNLIFTSIRIDTYKFSLKFFPLRTFLISSHDFFIEISPLFLEFISSIIESTRKSEVDIDIEIKNYIRKKFSYSFFIDPQYLIYPESLSFSLDSARWEEWSIRYYDISTLECWLHDCL